MGATASSQGDTQIGQANARRPDVLLSPNSKLPHAATTPATVRRPRPDPRSLPTTVHRRRKAGPRFQQTGEADAVCDSLLRWNLAVIEATSDLVCCYKPNIAFYEALGQPGMALLRQTIAAVPDGIPVLLDAKRGDIGSTAAAYARACFDELGVDAVTLSPYLGQDSIAPFAAYEGKGLFVLCHTSNPSAGALQKLPV